VSHRCPADILKWDIGYAPDTIAGPDGNEAEIADIDGK